MRPNAFSADQRKAHRAAGCTTPIAATKVSAEIAILRTSRVSSERVFFRNGKKRSSKNSTSARTPTAIIGATCCTLVSTGRSGHRERQLTISLGLASALISAQTTNSASVLVTYFYKPATCAAKTIQQLQRLSQQVVATRPARERIT